MNKIKIIKQFNSINLFYTDRLVAKKIQEEDFDKLRLMYTNQEVMATLGGIRSEDKTRDYVKESLVHWEKHQFGLWMFFFKESNEWIGRGGLRHVTVDGREEIELAYALMPSFWKKGLATEFALACIEIAFKVLWLDNIVCFTLATNKASQQIMENAGFAKL